MAKLLLLVDSVKCADGKLRPHLEPRDAIPIMWIM
jgi:hypothetical protein